MSPTGKLGKSLVQPEMQVTNDFDRHGIPLDFVWLDLETCWWWIYWTGLNGLRDKIFSDGVYS